MYSDQQLITGLAILVSAYAQLAGDISSYHWQIMVYLTWFSSLTHLTTLTTLRHYFRQNTRVRNLRLGLMLLNIILLAIALIPTGDVEWTVRDFGSVPASCYFQRIGSPPMKALMPSGTVFIVSLIILVFGSFTKAIRLSPRASSKALSQLRKRPSAFAHRRLEAAERRIGSGHSLWASKFSYTFWCVCYLILKAAFELYGSMLWKVRILA